MRPLHIVILPIVLLITSGRPSTLSSSTPLRNPHKKLARECEACHNARSFRDVEFDHRETKFPLDGKHTEVSCLMCHSIEDFSKVERSCQSCHDDVHVNQLGFECDKCHTTRAWDRLDAEEIHSRTDFPLLGRHVRLDCESCHRGQLPAHFTETPARCVACHQTDYLETIDPDHVASGLSTDCEGCHHASAWKPSVMPEHDPFFPIFSGSHRGRWNSCSNCHPGPAAFSSFDCLGCHEHDRNRMDPAHIGMQGYVYSSPECLMCHPRGDKGRFAEHALFFPIYSGAHNNAWPSCSTCHTDPTNATSFSCLNCHEHDQQRMDDKHLNEVTGYTYTSSACFECHPNGRVEEGN